MTNILEAFPSLAPALALALHSSDHLDYCQCAVPSCSAVFASREAHKLRVPRPPIRADAVGLEAVLHVDAARLVKPHAALLHDAQDLALGGVVEPRARVALAHVVRQ